jgi:hypothetical protein
MCYNFGIMQHEAPRSTITIAPELEAFNFEAIDEIRNNQSDAVRNASIEAAHQLTDGGKLVSTRQVRKEARETVEATFDSQITQFVDGRLNRDDNPERYDRVASFVKSLSIDHMDNGKWLNGDLDADGNRDFTTSGRYQLQTLIEELSTEPAPADNPNGDPDEPDVPPQQMTELDHTTPEAIRAIAEVKASREELAKLSVQRRQAIRKHGKNARGLEEKIAKATTRHNTAIRDMGSLYVNHMRGQGASDQTIREKTLPWIVTMHSDFTSKELGLLEADDSLRGRVAKFLARRGRLFGLSAATGTAAGFGARTASKAIAVTALGIAAPAAIAATAAIKSTKTLLMAKVSNTADLHRRFDQRQKQDSADVEKHVNETIGGNLSAEQALHVAVQNVGKTIVDRTEKDRRSNKRRAWIATGSAALAASAVEYGPDLYHHASGVFRHHGSHGAKVNGGASAHAETPAPLAPAAPEIDPSLLETNIPKGDGYIHQIQALSDHLSAVSGHNVSLSATQATQLYDHELALHGGSAKDFFTNDPGYIRSAGGWGISRPGSAMWNPTIVAEMAKYLAEQKTAA